MSSKGRLSALPGRSTPLALSLISSASASVQRPVRALGRRHVALALAVMMVVGLSGLSAEAAVSVVTQGRGSASSGSTFNLTIPAGETANGVVVFVHCTAVTLTAENVNVTVGGVGAPAIQGGSILHNGNDDDVQLETFYVAGNWAAGATVPVSWAWIGTTPTDYVVGAYALKGVSAVDWPFQAVKFRSDPILANPRSVVLPSMSTAINGTVVLWAFTADTATDTNSSANPALSGGTGTGWELSDSGTGNRIRAESWYGVATNASTSEILGTTTSSGGDSRVVLVGMSLLPIPPTVASIVRAGSNPAGSATVTFTVTFSEAVTGVGADDFRLTTTGVAGASIAAVSADSGATRTVTVNTGSGSGTIRLDVLDNDSIMNAEENPLGGPGISVTGNGSYDGGEIYDIDKTPPTVLSVFRSVTNPTNLDSVTFYVNFSEFVTGVGIDDFVLTTSGITGASVTSVWPNDASAWRLVTVSTGSGSGTLRLDVLADGSILDGLLTPLAEPFTSGQSYDVDKVPPTGTLVIDSPQYPPSAVVNLVLSATDANGVAGMRFGNDNLLWSLEEPYATTKTWTLSAGDGLKTVYVQYKDAMGNWSSEPITDEVIRDTTPPTGTVSVGTTGYINALNVFLTLHATDANGVKRMRFSHDNVTWTPDEVYDVSRAWTFPVGDDGLRTVYVQYQDDAGLWSTDVIKADVMLDTSPPSTGSASIQINGGSLYAASASVTLALSAVDDNGIMSMRFSNDNSNWSSEQAYTTSAMWSLSSGDGPKTVYVQYKDTAGNWSNSLSDGIELDMTPPAKPVMTVVPPTINQRPTWTWTPGGGGSGTYQWELDGSGLWTLTSNTSFTPDVDLIEGNHRMVVRERDDAGNWSEGSILDIFVDLTDPVLTVNALGLTNDTTPVFSGSVNDNLEVARIEVAVLGGNTYVGTFGGGTWHVQVPDAQPLVGAPPTSYTADVTATDTAGRTTTQRTYFAVDSTVNTAVSYISTVDAPFTSASLVAFDVVFTLGVRWVSIADFSLYTEGLTGASIVNVAGIADTDTWTVTVNTGSGEGTIRLDLVDQDTIIDIYNHPLGGVGLGNGSYSTGDVYTIDKTQPTVLLTSTVTSPSNLATIPVVASFNEDIPATFQGTPNFVAEDISVANATVADFEMVSTRVCHFNLHPIADGTVTVGLAADVAKDRAGNGNVAATSLTFESDRTAPVATVAGPGVATNVSPVTFTITFTEPVTGLTAAGISVLGGTKGALTGNGAGPYTLPVTVSTDGTVTCSVLAGVVQDAALNGNPASVPASVRLDRVAPRPTVTGPASPTNAFPIDFLITFDEPVTGLSAAAIAVTNGAKGPFSGSGAGPYTMSVYPTIDGPVTCQVLAGAAQDDAANPSVASNTLSIVSERGALSVDISAPSVGLTRNGPVSYTVTYTGASNITLQPSDVILNATGSAAGVIQVTGSGTEQRTVTINTITGTGTLGITVKAGTASDTLGHQAEAKGPSATFVVDNTAPVVTVNPLGTTNNTTPTLSGTVSDNIAVAQVNVTVDGTTYAARVTSTWWDVSITVPLDPGDYTASVTATDTVGNTATELMNFTMDPNAATKVEAITITGASPTNAASVDFLVYFSSPVTPVVAADFSLHATGTISGAAITGVAGSGKTRTVTVNTGSGDGTLRLDVIDRDTILDTNSKPLGGTGLGNGDFALGQAYTVDKLAPRATITLVSANPTGADTIVFRTVFSEVVVPGFDASKVTLTGTLAGIASVSGTFPVYTVTVILTDPGADGTVAISVGAGLTDLAGTPCDVSNSVVCEVYNWNEPPFARHPEAIRAYTGDSVSFTVLANCGTGLMNYQWKWEEENGKGVVHNVGGNAATLTLSNVSVYNTGQYWCDVTYDGVTRSSNLGSLDVEPPLEVTGPQDAFVPDGVNHTFSVTTTGGYQPLAYAWTKVGHAGTLSTEAELVLNMLTREDEGTYQVEVSDSNGTVIVKRATLTISNQGLPVGGGLGIALLMSGLAVSGSLLARRRK